VLSEPPILAAPAPDFSILAAPAPVMDELELKYVRQRQLMWVVAQRFLKLRLLILESDSSDFVASNFVAQDTTGH